jgi:hypothetical protein
MTVRFELKLANGKNVEWSGSDGEDAARRYVDCHRDDAVVAHRPARGPLITVLDRARIEG